MLGIKLCRVTLQKLPWTILVLNFFPQFTRGNSCKSHNNPKPQPQSSETLEKTLYKSSTEQLHLRAVEERIKHNFTSCYNALMPREY